MFVKIFRFRLRFLFNGDGFVFLLGVGDVRGDVCVDWDLEVNGFGNFFGRLNVFVKFLLFSFLIFFIVRLIMVFMWLFWFGFVLVRLWSLDFICLFFWKFGSFGRENFGESVVFSLFLCLSFLLNFILNCMGLVIVFFVLLFDGIVWVCLVVFELFFFIFILF